MKTKTHKKNSINIITLGCSKNLVDSEVMANQLATSGFSVEHESNQQTHNIVIINTCGFIDKAKEESINTILNYSSLKKNNEIEKLYVTGCLSERYREDLKKEIPEVDDWFGTMDLQILLKKLNADYKKELLGERLLFTPTHYAFLKISEGCNRTCSFCAIPLMRGKHVSKPIEAIVAEAKALVKSGVKEIMLIAQELTFYGLDIYKKRMLSELLEELSSIVGLRWIRLHYAYPTDFPLEIIDVIKAKKNICNYLDMPLQHASDKLLKSMRRNITQQEMRDLIKNIREKIPNICLRSSFIVGYPSETKEDIEILKNFLAEIKFDRVGFFSYSHEEDTKAFSLKDEITPEEKEQRIMELMEWQEEISLQKNNLKIDSLLEVLIDRIDGDRYIGRTEFDSVEVDNEVILQSEKKLKIGEFYLAKITAAHPYDLEGEIIIEN